MNHPDVYEKYKKEVEQSKQYQLDTDVGPLIGIKVKFKSKATQNLFEKHFRIIESNGDEVRVVCYHCRLVLKGTLSSHNFRRHLKVFLHKTNIKFYFIYYD